MPTSADELPALKDAAADALIALQWIRANGRTYRYDPATIFVAGGSAGGRIATVLGCRETGDMGGLPTTDPFSTTNPASSISSDASAIYDRTGLSPPPSCGVVPSPSSAATRWIPAICPA